MSKFFRKVDFGNGVKCWYIGDWKFAKKAGNCFYLLGKKKMNMKEGSGMSDGMTGSLRLPMKSADMKKEMENFI